MTAFPFSFAWLTQVIKDSMMLQRGEDALTFVYVR